LIIPNGATGVSTYWVLRDSTNHVPTTGIAVTGLSLSYIKEGFAISDPVSASGLASASADYTANNAFELGKGWYRIDWPDIFDGGIGKKVFLTVEAPSADTAFREVELSPSVNISYVESVGSVTGSVGSVTVTTGYSLAAEYDAAKTAASQTTVNDIPTNAELEARTLPSAQYVTTGSTIAGVIAVTTTTGYSLDSDYDSAKTAASQASVDALPTTGDIKTSLEAAGSSIAQILTDTNELQQNQSGWLTATGFTTSVDVSGISTIDTKVDAVSGYVDEIESRLTAIRASYLDNLVNLDVAVGSRAPSATALSTGTWTAEKAGFIDVAISSVSGSSSSGATPQEIWEYASRTLTSGGISSGTVEIAVGNALTTYTAAKTGDEMDLVDAPNPSAITAIQSGISLFDAATDHVIVSGYSAGQSPSDLVTGFSTHSAADVKTAVEAAGSHLTIIKTKTDSLVFSGTDVKATLDGEKVTVTSNEDKTGYALTSAYNAATGAASSGDITTALNTYDSPTKTEMDAAFTEIKGATWASGTDSLEKIRDRGDAAWATATGFTTAAVWTDEKAGFIDVAISSIEAGSGSSGATAQEIWEYASRTLTSGGIQSGDITDVVSGVLASYGTAKTGDAMTLTAAYDAAKTAASQASVDALPTTGDIKTSLEAEGSSVAQILADTNELQQNQSGWLTATGFATPANVSGISTIDTKVDAVSGYVDEIESRLTATRAGYLDNLVKLDVEIGSRAPSATALSTEVWTAEKAGLIDVAISSVSGSSSSGATPQEIWEYENRTLTSGGISSGTVETAVGNALATYTAAKTGDEMDIVDSPNPSAISAIQSGLATSSTALSNLTWTDEKAGFIDAAISSVSTSGASASAIAGAVRTELTTELERIDVDVSSRLATSGYTTAPTTGDIKSAIEISGGSVAQILTDTNELQTNQSGWLTATGFATPANVSGISVIDTKITTVSGYVDEIESRLTTTRAGYLDNLVNLDTTVGSRAPSATALSTAVWTNTKAGYIDTTIGSRLASASYTTPPTTGDIKTSMEAEGGLLNSINSKTTNLPSDPADQSTLETLITDNALTAADVWAYATRTITSGGVTPQQIWEYATRTITSGGVTAQQIWEYTTRTITSGVLTAQQVWDYATRTITAGGLTSGEAQAAVALALVAYEAAKAGDQMDLINVPNASAVSVIQSGLATATNLNLVKQVTDKVDTALELDGDVYRFTTNSLEMIPAASAEITAENIENIRIEIDTNSTKLAEILEDTSTSIPSAISSIPTGETITAEEIVTELLTTDYTSSTGTNTIGKWINAVRTLLGHKSVENTDGTEVSFKNDDESETEAGTQTWNNTTKTRGKYTGW
jgi:hypothetical protein